MSRKKAPAKKDQRNTHNHRKKLQERTQENPYFTLNYKENSGFPTFSWVFSWSLFLRHKQTSKETTHLFVKPSKSEDLSRPTGWGRPKTDHLRKKINQKTHHWSTKQNKKMEKKNLPKSSQAKTKLNITKKKQKTPFPKALNQNQKKIEKSKNNNSRKHLKNRFQFSPLPPSARLGPQQAHEQRQLLRAGLRGAAEDRVPRRGKRCGTGKRPGTAATLFGSCWFDLVCLLFWGGVDC